MKTGIFLRWLVSFSILFAYSGFLIFVDTHRLEDRAYAHEFTAVHSPAILEDEIAMMRLNNARARLCALLGKGPNCRPLLIILPIIIHIS